MTEKTAEQIAAEQAAQQAAAEKAAKAAEAKAKKEEEKAAKKAAAEAEKAAKKQAAADAKAAKEQAEADAKAKKEADKAAKEKAKADAKAAKEAQRQPEQNGVRCPGPDGLCGKVWALADAVSTQLGQATPIANLLEAAKQAGLNESNVRTEYARWKKFHGFSGRIVLAVSPAAE